MNRIEVNFHLNQSDLFWANRWWFLPNWYIKTLYTIAVLAIVSMVPFMVTGGFQLSDLRGFIVPSVLLILVPGFMYLSAWSTFRNLLPKQRARRYTFQDSGIGIDIGLPPTTLAWDAVHQVVENRRAFYVFPVRHKSLFHVVPKRGIRSKDELDKLRDLLSNELGPKAKIRDDDSGLPA